MKQNFTILIVGIVIGAGMTWAYKWMQPMQVIAAPFNCANSKHFVAEFPANDMKQVDIVVDGEKAATLPVVFSASGRRYENTGWIYLFKGVNATVTNKTNKTSTLCAPPADANYAPVNFGD